MILLVGVNRGDDYEYDDDFEAFVVVAAKLQAFGMQQQAGSYVCCWLVLAISLANCTVPWHLINLPDEHVPYYFFKRPKLKNLCRKSPDCPYQV